MRINGCTYLPVLVLFGVFTALQFAQAAAKPAQPAAKPSATYPQIVRLSYVEGDVRVARGKEAEKESEKTSGETTGWEQAVANLPLATGYSLATGTGRAEIEFEDASVVYLADNSVLEFYDISSTDGVPTTVIALLAGAASLNVQTLFPGERFQINTPGDNFTLLYPHKAYLRVNSFLDAIAVTPQKNIPWYAPLDNDVGKTITVHDGRKVSTPEMDTAAMAEWDKWVAGRVSARDAQLAAAMKDAGVTEPIPGLADLNGEGKFFSCAPYGTCWEPSEGWNGQATEVAKAVAQPTAKVVAQPAGQAVAQPTTQGYQYPVAQDETQPAAPVERVATSDDQQTTPVAGNVYAVPFPFEQSQKAQAYLASHPGATMWTDDYTMPCMDYPFAELKSIDPVTGKEMLVDSMIDISAPYPFLAGTPRVGPPFYAGGQYLFAGYSGMFNSPWDWAVCHAGGWVRWQHHYVWVAGIKRHHKPPVRWVKSGRQVGFVPLHPKDVAGKLPINMKYGIILPTKKGDAITVQWASFEEGKPVELLAEAPKEFRSTELASLKIAEAPQVEAYSAFSILGWKSATATNGKVKNNYESGTGFAMKGRGTPMTFDHKTQSFVVAQPETQSGRTNTAEVPVGGRVGSVQAAGNGSVMMRPSVNNGAQSYGGPQSNVRAQSRPTTTMGSNTNNGSSTRAYSPAPAYSAPARSYSAPAPSFSGGGGGGASHSSGGSSGGGSSHR